MLNKANSNNKYRYYHLLSGLDLPLRKSCEIYEYFGKQYGKEFVSFKKNIDQKVYDRVKYYHFFQKHNRKNIFFRLLEKISLLIQKILRVNRLNEKEKINKGANWFSITNDFSEYVLSKEKEILNKYKYTLCSDEIFMQTLIQNTNFEKRVTNFGDSEYLNIVRYIDWNRGKPYTFLSSDFVELKNARKYYLFARKFDEKIDENIINEVYRLVIDD